MIHPKLVTCSFENWAVAEHLADAFFNHFTDFVFDFNQFSLHPDNHVSAVNLGVGVRFFTSRVYLVDDFPAGRRMQHR